MLMLIPGSISAIAQNLGCGPGREWHLDCRSCAPRDQVSRRPSRWQVSGVLGTAEWPWQE